MEMGVPSVRPSKVPERIWQVSLSLRGVTILLWPGRRRSRSTWMSASVSGRSGGQPSTTTPTPPPWDSPHVVIRKRWPKVFGMKELRVFLTGLTRLTGFLRQLIETRDRWRTEKKTLLLAHFSQRKNSVHSILIW